MSLINDALKRAQRLRSPDSGALPPGMGPSSRSGSGRRGPLSAQLIILLVAGAAVLVSVSVFATVYLVRKPVSSIAIKAEQRVMSASENPPAAATQAPATAPSSVAASEPSPTPATVAPVLKSTDLSGTATPAPAVLAAAASPRLETTKQVDKPSITPVRADTPGITLPTSIHPAGQSAATAATEPHPQAESSPVKAAPMTAPEPKGSNQVQTLVDGFRVTGIRVSSGESKVLMNDRVYRLNDIVDRTHGVRLVEVSAEKLVFMDENGVRYVRNF